jgi:hypothetical protein
LHPEPFSGPRNVPFLGDGYYVAKLPEFHAPTWKVTITSLPYHGWTCKITLGS